MSSVTKIKFFSEISSDFKFLKLKFNVFMSPTFYHIKYGDSHRYIGKEFG